MFSRPTSHPRSPRIAAVVLAAGAALRMGGRPKCLLEWDGVPLVLRLLQAIEAAGLAPTRLVLGQHAQRIAAVLHGTPITPVINATKDPSPASSLRLGLAGLPDALDGVMVLLADQPLITAKDVSELVAAYLERPAGAEWVQPSVEGLPGNPVLFSPVVRAQILAGPPDMGGKQWQALYPQAVHAWPSDNVHYREDVDTPQDIESLGMRTGHWLRWPTDLANPR